MCIMRAEFYERTVAQRYEGYRIIAAFAICIVGSPAFNTLYCLFYNRNDAFLSAPDKLHAALCPLILEEKREGTCAWPHENSACGPPCVRSPIKTAKSRVLLLSAADNVFFFFFFPCVTLLSPVMQPNIRAPFLIFEKLRDNDRRREYFREEASSRAQGYSDNILKIIPREREDIFLKSSREYVLRRF